VTGQGHPRRIFATAIERGNIVMAEATARELGRIGLEEDDSLTIEEATVAASCLSALGRPSHDEAYGMLAAMAERATRQGRAGRVA
jgi:hypothetical protein